MRGHRIQALLYAAVLVLLASQPARAAGLAQEGAGGLVIATQPGEDPAEEITIVFADASTGDAAYYIYLRNEGDTDLTGVMLRAVNVRDNTTNELVEGFSVTFTASDEDLPEEGLTIPAGRQVSVRLALTNFTAEGGFKGELVAEAGGAILASTVLSITRAPEPDLGIVGFSDTGVELTQLTNQHTYVFTVYSRNETSIADLQVSLDEFDIANAPPVQATVKLLEDTDEALQPAGDTPEQFPISGLDAIHVQVTLDLPEEGEYNGNINLTYNGKRVSYPIKVTRARLPVSVDVLGLDNPVTGTTDNVKLWMVLSENKGRAVKLNPPTLLSLNRKEDETTSPQAQYKSIALEDLQGAALQSPLELQGREPRGLNLKINGLAPGEYTGILEVGSADGAPVRKEIKILVRAPLLFALLAILAGILFSFALRELLPRLQRQTQFRIEVEEQRLDLESLRKSNRDLDQREADLLDKLELLLVKLGEREEDVTQPVRTELENIRAVVKLLPKLIGLRRSIPGLPQRLEGTYMDRREEFLAALETAPAQAGDVEKRLETLKTELLPELKAFASELTTSDEQIWFKSDETGKTEWTGEKDAFLGRIDKWAPHTFPDIVRKFWEGHARYAQATAGMLLKHHQSIQEHPSNPADISRLRDMLQTIETYRLKEIGEEEVTKLLDRYMEARGIYEKLPPKGGMTPLDVSPADPYDELAGRKAPARRPARTDPAVERARLRALARRLKWSIYFLAFLIAVGSGYALLYMNNLTWGEPQDYVLALAWGLGLFEASNASLAGMTGLNKFGGLSSVVTSYTNPPAPDDTTTG